MISSEFKQVYINNESYLMKQMPGYNSINRAMSDFLLLNNDLFLIYSMTSDRSNVLYYKTQNYISLGERLTQVIEKKNVITMLNTILQTVEAMTNGGISVANVIWNWNYIFIDRNSGQLKFLLLPIEMHLANDYEEILNFIKNFLVTIKYDLTENCHYVAQLITAINTNASSREVLNEFSKVVRDLLRDNVMKHKPEKNKSPKQDMDHGRSTVNIAINSWDSLINNNQVIENVSVDKKPISCLVRIKTGENIQIVGNVFKIGKDPATVDYVITGNKAVSRFHAKIYNKQGVYYIEDNNSTNKTYVDGIMLAPNEQKLLIKGMIINIAGEEFQYNII